MKIRGFRVELGEVAAVLGRHPAVAQAAVVDRDDPAGNRCLVAYLVFRGEATAAAAELAELAASRLPAHMVPAAFVSLPRLPTTAAGKLDRRALPEPEWHPVGRAPYVAPRGAVEEALARIWEEVLQVGPVGSGESFFALGGHSLLATQVVSRTRAVLGVELPLRRLFETPTIAGLASAVAELLGQGAVALAPPPRRLPRGGALPLSFAQERLWFLHRFDPSSTSYHLPVAVRLRGRLELPALGAALDGIVARHEPLRTTFAALDGRPAQVIAPPSHLALPAVDLGGLPPARRELEVHALAREEARRTFDLARGPLVRTTLLRLAAGEHAMLLNMHHIVSDGWSLEIFLRDLGVLYQAFSERRPSPLPELPIQYADFASWQRQWLSGGVLDAQLAYWRGRLAGAPAVLALPADRPRPAVQGLTGSRRHIALSSRLTADLARWSDSRGVTLFMTVLAAFAALLGRMSGQTDVVLGAPIAGRNREETEPLIGFFINTLVLRCDLAGEPSFAALAERLREITLEAYSHQDVPFEKLVEALSPERNLSHTPLFQVMFAWQNMPLHDLELPGLKVEPLEVATGSAKFDLNLSLNAAGEGLFGWIEYGREIFDGATAARLLRQLETLLAGAVGSSAPSGVERPIAALPLLDPVERHQLVVEWNDTAGAGPAAVPLHSLFRAQAARTSGALAVACGDGRLTYGELDERAERLARFLLARGARPGEPVAVWMRRGLDMVPALLGILAAGCYYVPFEPDWPAERRLFILVSLAVRFVVTDAAELRSVERLLWRAPDLAHVLCLDVETPEPLSEPFDAAAVRGLFDHVAQRATDRVSAAGFVSSFTGASFAESEVDEYLARVVALAAPYAGSGKRVLEIGCGSGLVLFALAGETARYVGLDPSAVTQERNRERALAEGMDQVELVTGFAHEVDGFEPGSFDLVVVASTVQFFPGLVYLERVVRSALRLLAPGGALLIADVLDERRAEELRLALEEHRRQHRGDPAMRTRLSEGTELTVDEGYFADLATLPEVGAVRVLHRTAGFDNELRFRYDVVLEKAAPGATVAAGGRRRKSLWTAWHLGEVPALPLPDVPPDAIAYIIFTSGSTGVPKGVVVRHRPVVNLIEWANDAFGMGPDDRVLFVTSLCFDLSVYDVFALLAAGGSIEVATEQDLRDPQELVRLLCARPVTFWDSAPAALQRLVPLFPAPGTDPGQNRLRLVFLSGDWIPVGLPDQVRRSFPAARVIALGGATEATVWSNFFPVEEVDPQWRSIPYGRPIVSSRYHVLDGRLDPCPIGVPGDLYIGGICLATAYAGDPAQTAEKFIADPFGGEPGGRLYRTGDRARYRVDGNLEFLGRSDTQVKIRGFRIEQGEVESALAAHPDVREAVVAVREDVPGDRRLVAYVVPRGEGGLDAADLRAFVRGKLPDYMVPAAFVTLAELPVTANGKLDRKALPAPQHDRREGEPVALPETVLERTIAAIWREILGLDHVGVDDNFFELGGHSLLMAEVLAKLRQQVDVPFSMVDLFRHPTIRTLAGHLGAAAPGEAPAPAPAAGVGRAAARASSLARPDRHVAVIGMAGRFPGAASVAELWRNLCGGVESISFFTADELAAAGVDPRLLADPRYVRARGVIAGADLFDAAFFGYTPREAEAMDPQHRLFLECAWGALEDAGYVPGAAAGSIGLYAGAGFGGYLANLASRPELLAAMGEFQALIGNDKDFLPTRVSYKLDLKGPSVSVQTACSTSLVAVHLACQSLVHGECDMALAGGVSVRVPLAAGYLYQEGGIVSPDGHCRAFSADARGTVGGSGAGVVVLKPLDRALADGDSIYAVIRGSAVNNDGAAKVGYTAPSVEGQAAVIAEAQAMAEVEPETIGYVEAHGTGTALGDPVEIAALAQVFRGGGDRRGTCAIGSVKTNLGHLDAAAGVAGLIKTALALHDRVLPPSLHCERTNPEIDFAATPFAVHGALRDWPANGSPRRAGVSSFGIGGTNAHLVLEEAPEPEASEGGRPWQILTLSARTASALDTATAELADHLARHPGLDLADVAYTLQVGRKGFDHRRIAICRDREDAVQALRGPDPRRVLSRLEEVRERPVAFLLPGQGAQRAGMGADLYRSEAVFRAHVDLCADLLESGMGGDIRRFFSGEGDGGRAAALLEETAFVQPLLFVLSSGLARLFASWGVVPRALLGHSLGEYVAAHLAGVLSLPDALALVAARGELMQRLPAGAMLAVPLAEAEIEPLLGDELSLAAVNGPAQCVVSGPEEPIAALAAALGRRGLEVRRLHTRRAFHSAMMEPLLAPFRERLARLELAAPRVPYVSNLTGTWIRAAEATDPDYWVEHLRRSVRFGDGLRTLLEEPEIVLLELGPGQGLGGLARRQENGAGRLALSALGHRDEARPESEAVLTALGRLWLAGAAVDWPAFHAGERRRRLHLPTYPFERRRFWIDAAKPASPLAERRPDSAAGIYLPIWKGSLPPGLLARSAERPGRCLLFLDDSGLGERLARRLESDGREVVRISAGEDFARLSPGHYRLAPAVAVGYEALLRDLADAPLGPVVHLWSVAPDQPAASLRGPQETGLASLLCLARAWRMAAVPAVVSVPLRVDIVASGLFRVTGGEALALERATVLAAVEALPRELPGAVCRAIDVRLGEAVGESSDDLARLLLAELRADSPDLVVAYRGGGRWVRALEPVPLGAGEADAAGSPVAPPRQGGSYLVFGGFDEAGIGDGAQRAPGELARRWPRPRRPLADGHGSLRGGAVHAGGERRERPPARRGRAHPPPGGGERGARAAGGMPGPQRHGAGRHAGPAARRLRAFRPHRRHHLCPAVVRLGRGVRGRRQPGPRRADGGGPDAPRPPPRARCGPPRPLLDPARRRGRGRVDGGRLDARLPRRFRHLSCGARRPARDLAGLERGISRRRGARRRPLPAPPRRRPVARDDRRAGNARRGGAAGGGRRRGGSGAVTARRGRRRRSSAAGARHRLQRPGDPARTGDRRRLAGARRDRAGGPP